MARKIVAVDDSDIARELIVATLADFGYDTVETFSDSRAALEALSAQPETADLVLLDIMMPEMDGIELCARLRQLAAWRDVPIVMLTSRTDKAALSRAFMAGANDYLMKPFDRVEFQARLKAQLRLKAELDRRKTPAAPGAGARGAEPRRKRVPGLLGDQNTLLDALTTVDQSERLSVFTLTINALSANAADFSEAEQEALIGAVSRSLAAAPMPAGDLLVRWEGECFCGAALGRSPGEVLEMVEALADRAEAVLAAMPEALKGAEPSVRGALADSAGSLGPSEVLGNAFRALEAGEAPARGRIHLASRHGPSH
ncbi:response regulator [Roseivivax sp.]